MVILLLQAYFMKVKVKPLNCLADLPDDGNSWYRIRILWYCRGMTWPDQKESDPG